MPRLRTTYPRVNIRTATARPAITVVAMPVATAPCALVGGFTGVRTSPAGTGIAHRESLFGSSIAVETALLNSPLAGGRHMRPRPETTGKSEWLGGWDAQLRGKLGKGKKKGTQVYFENIPNKEKKVEGTRDS